MRRGPPHRDLEESARDRWASQFPEGQPEALRHGSRAALEKVFEYNENNSRMVPCTIPNDKAPESPIYSGKSRDPSTEAELTADESMKSVTPVRSYS